MSFTLPNLPYMKSALAPFMSEETLDYHYGKHHQAYVDNLNRLVSGTDFEKLSLSEIIKKSYDNPSHAGIFNNASQHYNHTEFWNSMQKGVTMSPWVKSTLEKAFGSVETFKTEIAQKGTEVFGSGWVWLYVSKDGKLEIGKFANGVNPLSKGDKEILGCDVWEHSYYIDYRNRRADYLKAWVENLINWEYVEAKLKEASL